MQITLKNRKIKLVIIEKTNPHWYAIFVVVGF